MKLVKASLSAAVAVVVMSSGVANAATGDWFVGLEYGAGKSGYEGSASANAGASGKVRAGVLGAGTASVSGKTKGSLKAQTFGIRLGKYVNDNVRVYASIEQTGYKGNLDVKGGTATNLSLNALPKSGKIKVGYNANLAASSALAAQYSAKDLGIKNSTSLMMSSDYVFMANSPVRPFVGASVGAKRGEIGGKKKTGMAYGFQAGVLTQLAVFDIEAGVDGWWQIP